MQTTSRSQNSRQLRQKLEANLRHLAKGLPPEMAKEAIRRADNLRSLEKLKPAKT